MLELIYTSDDGRSVGFGGPPFYLTDLDGAHGLTADVHSFPQYLQDGVTYVASQLQARDITIRFRIVENVIDNRIKLLQVMSPKVNGTLTLRRNGVSRRIKCVIAQAPSFAQQNGANGSVILFCPNPFWEAEGEKKTEIASWQDGLEWPLEFPVEGFEFGTRTPSAVINVYNEGDVPVGFRVMFRALGSVNTPSIVEVDTYQYIRVNTTMSAGDRIEISTVRGEKYARFIRANGVTRNAFPDVDKGSVLSLQLARGDNLYRFDAVSGTDMLDVHIYYNLMLLGV